MAKAKYTKGVTTVGEASFAHTIKTEEYNGKDTNKFSVNLHLGDKDTKKLKAKIADEWKKFTESEEGKKNKYKYDPELGCKEYKDKEYFKFKMTHIIETKKGDWERHVPIFDASGADISGKIGEIGNGSKVKVAYELVPFFMSDKNYGISLRLTAIQVLDMVEFGAESADEFGFGKEEGFVQTDEGHIEVPFDEDDEPEEDF